MKRIAFLIVFAGLHFCSFGQEIRYPSITLSEFRSIKIDTTYYEEGQIETITRQSLFVRPTEVRYKVTEIKTVFQYDKCGNLRNTSVMLEDNDPMRYGVLGPRRWIEDKVSIGVTCDVPWIKPLII